MLNKTSFATNSCPSLIIKPRKETPIGTVIMALALSCVEQCPKEALELSASM
jgi:hypothetical protein